MAEKSQSPKSYQDPYWLNLAAQQEAELKLPTGSLRSIITHGERTNADRVSEAGAKGVVQITPPTRDLVLNKYGVDAYLNDKNAIRAAGLIFKEGFDRNNGDPIMAAREYHGGTDRKNWGPINASYAKRYAQGLQYYRQPKGEAQQESLSSMVDAYQKGALQPDKAAEFEQQVKDGTIVLPPHISAKIGFGNDVQPTTNKQDILKKFSEFQYQSRPSDAQGEVLPIELTRKYAQGGLTPDARARLEADVKAGKAKLTPLSEDDVNGMWQDVGLHRGDMMRHSRRLWSPQGLLPAEYFKHNEKVKLARLTKLNDGTYIDASTEGEHRFREDLATGTRDYASDIGNSLKNAATVEGVKQIGSDALGVAEGVGGTAVNIGLLPFAGLRALGSGARELYDKPNRQDRNVGQVMGGTFSDTMALNPLDANKSEFVNAMLNDPNLAALGGQAIGALNRGVGLAREARQVSRDANAQYWAQEAKRRQNEFVQRETDRMQTAQDFGTAGQRDQLAIGNANTQRLENSPPVLPPPDGGGGGGGSSGGGGGGTPLGIGNANTKRLTYDDQTIRMDAPNQNTAVMPSTAPTESTTTFPVQPTATPTTAPTQGTVKKTVPLSEPAQETGETARDTIKKALEEDNAAIGNQHTPEDIEAGTNNLVQKLGYLNKNQDLVVGALRGDQTALSKMAAEADINADLVEAFRSIGLVQDNLPIGVVSQNTAIQSATGFAASQPNSAAEIAHKTFKMTVARNLDDLAKAEGSDASLIAQKIKNTMGEEQERLKTQVDNAYNALRSKIDEAGQSSELGVTDVPASKTLQVLNAFKEAKRSPDKINGGTYVSDKAISAKLKELEQDLKRGTSYSHLDALRKDIGESLYKSIGTFKDESNYQLTAVYNALLKDLDSGAASYGFANDVTAAKELAKELFAHQDNQILLFGKTLADDYLKDFTTALKNSFSAGRSNQVLNKLLSSMPKEWRGQALNSALYQTFMRGDGRIKDQNMATLWANMRNNNQNGLAIIKKTLGDKNFERWNSMAKVAQAMSNYEQFVIKTGRALFANLEGKASQGSSVIQEVLKGASKLITSKTGGVGDNAISNLFSKFIPDTSVSGLAELLNSPEFLKASITTNPKKRLDIIKQLSKKPLWKRVFGAKVQPEDVVDILPDTKGK